MSLKLLFLASHLEYFPPNLGAVSEEQGKKFQQDLKDVEQRYQGRWDVNTMADCCWSIARFERALKSLKNIQILRETEKGDRGILTYISKECNVSKLSTHVTFTSLAKLFCLCVIVSLFYAYVILYIRVKPKDEIGKILKRKIVLYTKRHTHTCRSPS